MVVGSMLDGAQPPVTHVKLYGSLLSKTLAIAFFVEQSLVSPAVMRPCRCANREADCCYILVLTAAAGPPCRQQRALHTWKHGRSRDKLPTRLCCPPLVRRLGEGTASGNVAEVLAAIARARSSPLTSPLCGAEALQALIARIIVPPPGRPSVQARSLPALSQRAGVAAALCCRQEPFATCCAAPWWPLAERMGILVAGRRVPCVRSDGRCALSMGRSAVVGPGAGPASEAVRA